MWKIIYDNGRICENNLSIEDMLQIKKVESAYQASVNLQGYCPAERAMVMRNCAEQIDPIKYDLGFVTEHYGVSYYALRKNIE